MLTADVNKFLKIKKTYSKPDRFLKPVGFLLFFICLARMGEGYVPLDTLLRNSPYIFEGTVVSNQCFLAPDGNIYTSNIVKVTKIIYGNVNCGNVEIVTVGGTVDSITEWVTGALAMNPGGSGIVFCIPSQWPSLTAPAENPIALSVFADRQGVLPYGLTYSLNPHPDDDSALAFWNKGDLHFFTGHRAALDSFQDIFGHGYINCGPTEDDSSTNFSFYPNPVMDYIHFNIPGTAPAIIYIYDMTGRLVFTSDPGIKETNELKLNGFEVQTLQRLNISLFRQGIYTGTAETQGNIYKFKLIKI